MITYTFFALLVGGLYYLTFRNSPKHATILLLIVAVSVGIGFIQPRETLTLIGLAVGVIGAFTVIIQSRKERERKSNDWFAQNGFIQTEFPEAAALFNTSTGDTTSYCSYKGKLTYKKEILPFILTIRHTSSVSNNSVSVVIECSYYFFETKDIDTLKKKFITIREATPHTAFFDIKNCQIFMPTPGGIVVSWRVPDMIDAYNARYEWIKNVINN